MSLLDMPRPPATLVPTRTHRMDHDDDESPKETPMPTGVYPRKPAITTAPQPATSPSPKAKGKGRKRAKAKPVPPKLVGAARFLIDERGGMEIRDGQQVIQIERDDVARLRAFLGRGGVRA